MSICVPFVAGLILIMLAYSSNKKVPFENIFMVAELKVGQKQKYLAFSVFMAIATTLILNIFSRHWFMDCHYVGML